MSLPEPKPGLVIRYACVWRDEAARGAEEGRKDRPCVVLFATTEPDGRTAVVVAPFTHTAPRRSDIGVEAPPATKTRLGLDEQRSWIVTDNLNRFVWPGFDLRPLAGKKSSVVYGALPESVYAQDRAQVLALVRQGRIRVTSRDER